MTCKLGGARRGDEGGGRGLEDGQAPYLPSEDGSLPEYRARYCGMVATCRLREDMALGRYAECIAKISGDQHSADLLLVSDIRTSERLLLARAQVFLAKILTILIVGIIYRRIRP